MKTYNAKLIFENDADKQRVLDVLSASRTLFNECSTVLFELHGYQLGVKIGKPTTVSIVKLHHSFYRTSRENHPDWPAQLSIRAYKACLAAYKAVKSNKHEITQPVEKHSLSLQLDKRLYAFRKGGIFITALTDKRVFAKWQSYPKLAEMLANHELCDPNIYVDKDSGEIYIGLTFRTPQPTVSPNGKALGIDLGKRRLASTSEGKIIKGNEFSRHKRRIRHLKRSLQAKGTKSARRHLRKLRRKEANFSRNYVHLVANELLRTDASILVLEDLASIKRKKGFENKNSISQVPFYLLRTMLEYKALSLGKRVTLVSPYNTSRDDSRGIKKGVRKGCRYYASDGAVLDADINAACNIRNRYVDKNPLMYHSNSLGGDAKLIGQAPVNEPIVCKPFLCESATKHNKPPVLTGGI